MWVRDDLPNLLVIRVHHKPPFSTPLAPGSREIAEALPSCVQRHTCDDGRALSLTRMEYSSGMEYAPIPTPIYISLWVSAIVYGIVGCSYFFHDLVPAMNPVWLKGTWPKYMVGTWQSMTSVGLLVLCYVCIDALQRGSITTQEIEIELLTVSLYAGLVFKMSLPMPLTVIVPLTKPECWLTVTLWLTAYDLVSARALYLSVFFVLYGVGHAVLQPGVTPFTMVALLEQIKENDPETAESMRKMVPNDGPWGLEQV